MSLIKHKLAAATAVAAAFSLTAMPVQAVGLPRVAHAPAARDPHALDVENRRHHGGDWDDDDWDVDGGDILAGVLILGGLAAIAGIANSGRHQEPVYQEPERWPEPEARYQVPARDDRHRAGGMAEAVDVCVAEVEDGRGTVGSVDRASRSGDGWYVAGALDGGTAFSCWIDGAGQVTDIEAGDSSASYGSSESNAGDAGYATLQKQAVEGEDGYALAQVGERAE